MHKMAITLSFYTFSLHLTDATVLFNRMYSQEDVRQQARFSLNQEIVVKRERFLHDLAKLERKSNEALTRTHTPERQSARLKNRNN